MIAWLFFIFNFFFLLEGKLQTTTKTKQGKNNKSKVEDNNRDQNQKQTTETANTTQATRQAMHDQPLQTKWTSTL